MARKVGKPTLDDIHLTVAFFRQLLKLEDWTIDVDFTGVEDQVWAKIEPAWEYKRAALHFNWDMVDSQETLNRVVVHELIHCVIHQYTQTACNIVGDNDVLKKILTDAEESVVTEVEKWPLWDILDYTPSKKKKS